jgi:FixJ family two-component response regulator
MSSLERDVVYLVDDDAEILSGIAMFLRDKHFEVRVFSNGHEFLKAFPLAQPSVIVLDMHMPELSGLDIQAKLLALNNTSPVFFLSGESKSQQIIDALKGGAYEFLLKPVCPNTLLESLKRAFAVKHKEEKLAKGVMMFGKHKKATYEDIMLVDTKYCDWILKQGDKNDEIVKFKGWLQEHYKKEDGTD